MFDAAFERGVPFRDMKHFCSVVVTAAMFVEGLIGFFPGFLRLHYGQLIAVAIAVVGIAAFAWQTVAIRREEREAKQREQNRDERDKLRDADLTEMSKLLRSMSEQRGLLKTLPVVETVPKEESVRLKASDPRVYVEIEDRRLDDGSAGNFPETLFVLRNEGGDVAHKVQIEPLSVVSGTAQFNRVETLPSGERKTVQPKIERFSIFERHDVARLLRKEWDAAGELTDEFSRPMRITYEDFAGTKFETAFTLLLHPIRDILKLRHKRNWPRNERETIEIIDVATRRLS